MVRQRDTSSRFTTWLLRRLSIDGEDLRSSITVQLNFVVWRGRSLRLTIARELSCHCQDQVFEMARKRRAGRKWQLRKLRKIAMMYTEPNQALGELGEVLQINNSPTDKTDADHCTISECSQSALAPDQKTHSIIVNLVKSATWCFEKGQRSSNLTQRSSPGTREEREIQASNHEDGTFDSGNGLPQEAKDQTINNNKDVHVENMLQKEKKEVHIDEGPGEKNRSSNSSKWPAWAIETTPKDCSTFADHLASKLRTYNMTVRGRVQHVINFVLNEADTGKYGEPFPDSPASPDNNSASEFNSPIHIPLH